MGAAEAIRPSCSRARSVPAERCMRKTHRRPPRARERFDERAKMPAMRNVVRVLRDYDDPVPPGVRDLDLITFFFAYHDTAFMSVDRAKMNRALFEALKTGGALVIADHSAQAGAGISVAKSLHRIEEATLRREIEAAGFRLAAEGDFLRHREDPRDSIVFRPKCRSTNSC